MRILGISAHYHDSAAALLVDGEVVAAAQEERFSRVKHDRALPLAAARFCLGQGGLSADELDAIAYYEKPFHKFDRLVAGFLAEAPRGLGRFVTAVPRWLGARLWVRAELQAALDTDVPVCFLQHHESHAAAAFGPSPFDEAAVLTIDGVGEWTTNGLWHARGSGLAPLLEIRYPDSIGLLYSAFTAYCGFRVNDGEYKLMGLAPYGEPRHVSRILDHLLELKADGSYRLNPEHFAYRSREAMTTAAFHRLFGGPPCRPGTPPGRREADLARSIQAVTEEVLLRQARTARARTGSRALCLAGGVALNCVANGRLARERIADELWIQPAAGDAGGALGAAYALWFRQARPGRTARDHDAQHGSLLGPEFRDDEVEEALVAAGLDFTRPGRAELVGDTAAALAAGEVVGWFQGRMEYGPRALGNRSILADPRDPGMQSRVNLRVKFRESFRPFAPVVLERRAADWFTLPAPASPYMLLTGAVKNARPLAEPAAHLGRSPGIAATGSPLPAVTHVDGSARVQTLAAGANPLLEELLERFAAATGCPALLNTSFNRKDEPIVCTPRDAVACFLATDIDRLVIGGYVARRAPDRPAPPPAPRPVAPPATRRASLAAAGAVAAFLVLGLVLRARVAGGVALGVGLTVAAGHLLAPALTRRLETGLGAVLRLVAHVAVTPLLVLVFALGFVPAGLLGRRRRRARAAETCWEPPELADHDPRRPY
ncbi:MAG TPA: carbamoyltransferase N-terminal domain-containing protein [Polyangia bacterium]|jgi:carbamoyltransferase